MTIILWLVAKTGLSPRVVKIALAVLAIVALVGGGILAWNLWLGRHDRAVIDSHESTVTAKIQTQGRAADQKLEQRKDAAAAARIEERKDFDNATSSLPKSGLSDRQHIDACRQLRRQGEPAAVLARAKCL